MFVGKSGPVLLYSLKNHYLLSLDFWILILVVFFIYIFSFLHYVVSCDWVFLQKLREGCLYKDVYIHSNIKVGLGFLFY